MLNEHYMSPEELASVKGNALQSYVAFFTIGDKHYIETAEQLKEDLLNPNIIHKNLNDIVTSFKNNKGIGTYVFYNRKENAVVAEK